MTSFRPFVPNQSKVFLLFYLSRYCNVFTYDKTVLKLDMISKSHLIIPSIWPYAYNDEM